RASTTESEGHRPVRGCIVQSWGLTRKALTPFSIEDVPLGLCTHIIYSYLTFKEDTGEITGATASYKDNKRALKRLFCLKLDDPDLKLIVTIGNGEMNRLFMKFLPHPNKRQKFVSSAVRWLLKFGFDGLNLHWEGRGPTLCTPFTTLLIKLIEELREAFAKYKFTLTVQLPACRLSCNVDLDKGMLGKLVDYVFLMTYDYRSTHLDKTDVHSQLYGRTFDPSETQKENTEDCAGTWVDAGVPKYKIVLGLSTFGKTFTLANPNEKAILSPVNRNHPQGLPGEITKCKGMLGYMEICRYLNNRAYKREWDAASQTPFAYSADQWIGFDDTESIARKVFFTKGNKLGGVFIWSLDLDDYTGDCSGTNFPIARAINSTLSDYNVPTGIVPEGCVAS
ncbi:unnamed protein product, partial [Ixodes hexagonus]